MLLELLVALENRVGQSVDADRLNSCLSVGDVETVLREVRETRRLSGTTRSIEKAEAPLELPPALREAAMTWLGRAQIGFYDQVLHTKISGRAFIPHNRNVIVAANHASHLDMGLVKYALGSYGDGLVSLAAQDYFFEGPRWRRLYFEAPFFELARAVGYQGLPVPEARERIKALCERFGEPRVRAASAELIRIDTSTDPPTAQLTDEAHGLCRQLLGPPPGGETSTSLSQGLKKPLSPA